MARTARASLVLVLLTISALSGCLDPASIGDAFTPPDYDTVCPEDQRADPPLALSGPVVQWREDAARSGFAPDARVPDAVDLAWRVDVNPGKHTAAKGSAVLAPNGLFLVGGDDGVLRGVTEDGDVAWEARTGPSGNGIHGTPTVVGDVAFVGAYDGVMYAFNASTGDLHWCSRAGGYIGASPLYLDERILIMAETDVPSGRFVVMNASTGEVEHVDPFVNDHPHSSLAFDADANVVVAGANDGVLYAWNASNLDRAWTFETDGAIKGPITMFDGAAFFGSWDGYVYRVDVANGTLDWRFGTNGKVMSGAGVHPPSRTVFIGAHDGHVYALDAATGEEAWRYDTGGSVISSPVVTPNGLLVGSYDEQLHALTLEGALKWAWHANGIVTSSALVLEDGRVLFTDRADDGRAGALWALHAA